MKYFWTLLSILVFLAGCEMQNHHKGEIKYKFIDQNQKSYQIEANFKNFNLYDEKSKEDVDKITLVMFLDLNSQDSKDYILSLNHLLLSYPKMSIFGILNQPYSQEEINQYAKENQVNFALLSPEDSKNMFQDFIKEVKTAQNQANENESEQFENQEPLNGMRLPYFILYDKNGKQYQNYTGIVPEEMFAQDINTIIKSHSL